MVPENVEIIHHPPHDAKNIPFIYRSEDEQQDEENNYYCESRGPILKIQARRADVHLSFDPSVLNEIPDAAEKDYFCEELDLFSATTRGKDTRIIKMKNEGTTAIRFQWMRFPPNAETCIMLSNPADVFNETGNFTDVLKLQPKERKHYNIISNTHANESQAVFDNPEPRSTLPKTIIKQPALEFRFKELPNILLAGQSLEFSIVFRSQKQGYFYETLYLLTYPILKDNKGRTYSVRLTGICMDHDLLTSDPSQFRDKNIEEGLKCLVLEHEAMDIMGSILDQVLFEEPDDPTTSSNIAIDESKTVNTNSEKCLENENLCAGDFWQKVDSNEGENHEEENTDEEETEESEGDPEEG